MRFRLLHRHVHCTRKQGGGGRAQAGHTSRRHYRKYWCRLHKRTRYNRQHILVQLTAHNFVGNRDPSHTPLVQYLVPYKRKRDGAASPLSLHIETEHLQWASIHVCTPRPRISRAVTPRFLVWRKLNKDARTTGQPSLLSLHKTQIEHRAPCTKT